MKRCCDCGANPIPAGGVTWYVSSPGKAIADFARAQPALYNQLTILERFNGQAILERYTGAVNSGYWTDGIGWRPYVYYAVSIESQRLPFFHSAYDSLKASTYQSLYLQTAGKELLDQVELGGLVGNGQAQWLETFGWGCAMRGRMKLGRRNAIRVVAFCAYSTRLRTPFDKVMQPQNRFRSRSILGNQFRERM